MAVIASTPTTTCMTKIHNNYKNNSQLQISKPYNFFYSKLSHFKAINNTNWTNFASLPNETLLFKKFLGRCVASENDNNKGNISSSISDTTTTTTTTTMEMEEEKWEGTQSESSPVEMPKGPPSLISPLNVQKALRGIAITDVDHYARLGLGIGCSYDEVRVAYKDKVNALMSQGLDEEELNKQQELLKESYAILSSEEERRLYDWSLARSENPERYAWPFEVDITQTPKGGTPPPQEPENVGPTRLVGYFLLGWVVLSVVLSIYLNL